METKQKLVRCKLQGIDTKVTEVAEVIIKALAEQILWDSGNKESREGGIHRLINFYMDDSP